LLTRRRKYENNIIWLSNALSRAFAPSVVHAHNTVTQAVLKYFGSALPDIPGATKLVLNRNRALHDGGMKPIDMARLENMFALALLTNTVPTVFWTLFDISSRPDLVATLREEIAANAVKVEQTDAGPVHVLDLSAVRTDCPQFASTLLEVLRMRFSSTTTRLVTTETQLGEWTLRKGNLVQVPSHYFNQGVASWGADAATFDPRRFLRAGDGGGGASAAALGPQGLAKGFLTFGISPHVCPGRHFAVGEIAALVSMLLLRFDLAPEGGVWKEPGLSAAALTSSMSPVAGDVQVTPLPRKEYAGARWEFRVSETNNRFNLPI
jgi:cytochrome P450